MSKTKKITVKGTAITIIEKGKEEYVSLNRYAQSKGWWFFHFGLVKK